MNTAAILLAAFIALAVSVMSWVSIVISLVVLAIIAHVNFLRPYLRCRRLRTPVDAWFVIPPKKAHGCDFAVQDGAEHLTKIVVLPSNSEAILDLRFRPRLFLSNSEILIGCNGDGVPIAIEYSNRFIVKGEGQVVIPGPGNRHYIDKHGFYHYREAPTTWPDGKRSIDGSFISRAFKFQTKNAGRYTIEISFIGDEVEGKNSELIILVENDPQTVMRCVEPEHKRCLCKTTGIKPLSNDARHLTSHK
jgi:hypothetical protein